MNVYDQAHALARALKSCPEAEAYQAAVNRLRLLPSAYQMVKDFRARQMGLQEAILKGEQVTEEQMKALQNMHDLITAQPEIAAFMETERRLLFIFQDLEGIVRKALSEMLELPE